MPNWFGSKTEVQINRQNQEIEEMARNTGTEDAVATQFIDTVIENTKAKMDEKRAAVAVVAEARTMLHSFITQGLASPEQVAWIQENLPQKLRKPKDDNGEFPADPDDE